VLNHCNDGFSYRSARPLHLSEFSMANWHCTDACGFCIVQKGARKPQLHYEINWKVKGRKCHWNFY